MKLRYAAIHVLALLLLMTAGCGNYLESPSGKAISLRRYARVDVEQVKTAPDVKHEWLASALESELRTRIADAPNWSAGKPAPAHVLSVTPTILTTNCSLHGDTCSGCEYASAVVLVEVGDKRSGRTSYALESSAKRHLSTWQNPITLRSELTYCLI